MIICLKVDLSFSFLERIEARISIFMFSSNLGISSVITSSNSFSVPLCLLLLDLYNAYIDPFMMLHNFLKLCFPSYFLFSFHSSESIISNVLFSSWLIFSSDQYCVKSLDEYFNLDVFSSSRISGERVVFFFFSFVFLGTHP